jgi:SAM-dependent methyltransferase
MPEDDDPVQVWNAIAPGWERHHEELARDTSPVADRMMELAAVGEGEEVLELAAGLGDLSLRLARRVGATGRVICSDASPDMLAAARRRAEPTAPLSFQVLDAHQLGLDVDSVDAIVCKMGLMLLRDPSQAAAECRRVLRPGGRLVAATWGPLEHNPWITTFGAAMLTHAHAPPADPTGPGGIFSLSSAAALEALLETAGFTAVEVETVDVPQPVASFDEYWSLRAATSGPLTLTLGTLADSEVAAIRSTCEQYAGGFQQADGSYVFPGQALVTRAR